MSNEELKETKELEEIQENVHILAKSNKNTNMLLYALVILAICFVCSIITNVVTISILINNGITVERTTIESQDVDGLYHQNDIENINHYDGTNN